LVNSPRSTTSENRKTRFVWTSAVNATSYHLQVTDNPSFSPLRIDTMVTDTSVLVRDTLAKATLYYWRVCGVNLGGEGSFSTIAHFTTSDLVGVAEELSSIPREYALLQNYPNPFNPTTTIQYDLPLNSNVTLKIYDVLGRVVSTLVDKTQSASRYTVQWDASRLASGMYFYRFEAKSQDGSKTFQEVKKLMLLK
jgi:hypothetical protein